MKPNQHKTLTPVLATRTGRQLTTLSDKVSAGRSTLTDARELVGFYYGALRVMKAAAVADDGMTPAEATVHAAKQLRDFAPAVMLAEQRVADADLADKYAPGAKSERKGVPSMRAPDAKADKVEAAALAALRRLVVDAARMNPPIQRGADLARYVRKHKADLAAGGADFARLTNKLSAIADEVYGPRNHDLK